MRLTDKIKAVELEFGKPISAVMADFAHDHSYSFTVSTLGFYYTQLIEYQCLFTKRKQGYVPRPHMTKRNLDNAPRYWGYTVSQLAEMSGMARNTIRQRIRSGWSFERVISKSKHNGNIANLKNKRNNEIWRKRIHEECKAKIQSRTQHNAPSAVNP